MFHRYKYRALVSLTILMVLLIVYMSWSLLNATMRVDESKKILSAFFDGLSEERKLEFLRKVMDQEGVDAGWYVLESANIPGVGPLPYFIGTYMYEKYGSRGITQCPDAFRLGCRGGLLKAAVAAEGLGVMKDLEDECDFKGLGKTCGHGLGHGFSQFTAFDIKKALEYCDQLTQYSQVPCYGGVFQEYWEFAPGEMFSKDDVWKPCSGLPERHLSVCAFNLRDQWGARYQFDNSRSMELCLSADDRTVKLGCLLGIGFKIVKQQAGQAESVINECTDIFTDQHRPLCLISASNVFAVYKYPDWRESVYKMCRELDSEMRSVCRNAAEIQTLFATETLLKEFEL